MLEETLVYHSAPTLARLKAGSLFTVDAAEVGTELPRLQQELAQRGVTLTTLGLRSGRATLYVYRAEALEKVLRRWEIRAFLETRGYEDFTVEGALATLRARLSREKEYPHEVGVFLGYPLADVLAFIRSGGRKCACTGCWKAYADPDAAKRTFETYHRCQAAYLRLFHLGYPLSCLTVSGLKGRKEDLYAQSRGGVLERHGQHADNGGNGSGGCERQALPSGGFSRGGCGRV